MRRNSTSSMGALHPVLFFMLVYGISLVLAIFVCRTVYYSLSNENERGHVFSNLPDRDAGTIAILK